MNERQQATTKADFLVVLLEAITTLLEKADGDPALAAALNRSGSTSGVDDLRVLRDDLLAAVEAAQPCRRQ